MAIPIVILTTTIVSLVLIDAFAFPSQRFEDEALSQPDGAVPYVVAPVPAQPVAPSGAVLGIAQVPSSHNFGSAILSRDLEVTPGDVPPAFSPDDVVIDAQLAPSFSGSPAVDEVLARRTYMVPRGDTAASIAASQYGTPDFARVIQYANWLEGISQMVTAQTVVLPRVGSAPVHPPARSSAATVRYSAAENEIVVSGAGAVTTLSGIAAHVPAGVLNKVAPGMWYLAASLVVSHGSSLSLIGTQAGGDVDWLKLKSDTTGAVSLQAVNATIYMERTRISSWNERAGAVDSDLEDGRAFVIAKNTGGSALMRMDIVDSDLSYLGFAAPDSYGVSWRGSSESQQAASGTVLGSSFHDNYIGAYTMEASRMFWAANQFTNNALYGLDPHDGSNGFLVEYNKFNGNGRHGLMFSEGSSNNVAAFNSVFDNGLHGIVVDQGSDRNWVLNNDVHDNVDGIVLFESNANVLFGNKVSANTHTGVRLSGREAVSPASRNAVAYNDIRGNGTHGVQLLPRADQNVIQGNTILGQMDAGLFVNGAGNRIGGAGSLGNMVSGNRRGIVVEGSGAARNLVQGNDVAHNESVGILLETPATNLVTTNKVSSSRRAIVVNGETGTAVAFNTLSDNMAGIVLEECESCRLVGNTAATPADGTIQVSDSNGVIIEDQSFGDIHFDDLESTVSVVPRNGGVLRLGLDGPDFNGTTRVARIRALVPGARQVFQRTDP